MQNSVRKMSLLAVAFLLALSGAAKAGDNAGVELTLTSPAEVSGVGAGGTVSVSLEGSGLVGVRQFDVIIEVDPVDAFDLAATTFGNYAPFTLGGADLGVEFPSDNQIKSGAASLGATVDGDNKLLGTFELTTSATFNEDTEATIRVVQVSLGPSSSDRDVFTDTGFSVTVNPPPPPVTEPTLTAVSLTDASLDYSAVGEGDSGDGSAGEFTASAVFTDASGSAAAGQAFTWTVSNNGSESVYLLGDGGATEIPADSVVELDGQTGDEGAITATFDAEADRSAGTTSLSVSISATASNSAGEERELSVSYSATWDVPVAAELSGLTSQVTVDKDVLLTWDVASQSNNMGWEVYRSIDGRAYTKVSDMILGDGNSDEFKSYSFVDKKAPDAEMLFYYLNQSDLDGSTTRSQVVEVALADISKLALPTVTALRQNFPNPFNPETSIEFDLSSSEVVNITIYDITGQVIRTLVDAEPMAAGSYSKMWDGRNSSGSKVGSGVYFYQMRAGEFVDKRKMTLLQ